MPLTLHNHAVRVHHFASPLHPVLLEHALIEGTISPLKKAESLLTAIFKLSYKTSTIICCLLAIATLEPVLPASLVHPIMATILALTMEVIVPELALVELPIRVDQLPLAHHHSTRRLTYVYGTIFPADYVEILALLRHLYYHSVNWVRVMFWGLLPCGKKKIMDCF